MCGEGGQWGWRALEVLSLASGLPVSTVKLRFSQFIAYWQPASVATSQPERERLSPFQTVLREFLQAPEELSSAHRRWLEGRRKINPRNLLKFGWPLPRSLKRGLAWLDGDLLVVRTPETWKSFSVEGTPRLFGRFARPDGRIVVLVEGVLDAIHFPAGVGYAYLTSFPTREAISWLAKSVPLSATVVWWPDRDVLTPGKAKLFLQTASVLRSVFKRIIIFPWELISEESLKDPDDVAREFGFEAPWVLVKELIREV